MANVNIKNLDPAVFLNNVGIGTSSPSYRLDIKGAYPNSSLRITELAADSAAVIRLQGSNSTRGGVIRAINSSGAAAYLAIENGSSESMRIDASGNVGIGEDNPSSPNSVNKFLHIHDSAHCSLVMSDDSNTWEIVSNLALTFRDGTDTRLTIDSSGNVKVGSGSTVTVSTDADDLVIDKGAADTGLSILSTTTGRIYFGDAANNDAGSIRYVHSDDSMRFETDDTERMRITSDGRVDVDSILQSGLLYHNVLQFFHNGTISNGVKIKTNFPFDSASENAMPTIIIEGYDYRGARTIGLQIAWYPYNSQFYQATCSSFGSYTPVVKLARENDKVIIHLGTDENDWYYDSFNVRVLHNFTNTDRSSELTNWTWADEAITGDRIATLTYNNKVGNLTAEGNLVLPNLPDSNPGIAGALYRDGSNVKISL